MKKERKRKLYILVILGKTTISSMTKRQVISKSMSEKRYLKMSLRQLVALILQPRLEKRDIK